MQGGFGAMVFYTTLPVGTKKVETERVRFRIHNFQEVMPQFRPLNRGYLTFKDGELHALPKIGTKFGNVTEPALAGCRFRGDVIGDQYEHNSTPKKGWIIFQVAAKMAREQGRLNKGNEADGNRLLREGVCDFVFLALLPGGKNRFAGIV